MKLCSFTRPTLCTILKRYHKKNKKRKRVSSTEHQVRVHPCVEFLNGYKCLVVKDVLAQTTRKRRRLRRKKGGKC